MSLSLSISLSLYIYIYTCINTYKHHIRTYIHMIHKWVRRVERMAAKIVCTPNLPTKIIPCKIAWLKLSGEFPMGLEIPLLKLKLIFESNPLKSIILVWRLAVEQTRGIPGHSTKSVEVCRTSFGSQRWSRLSSQRRSNNSQSSFLFLLLLFIFLLGETHNDTRRVRRRWNKPESEFAIIFAGSPVLHPVVHQGLFVKPPLGSMYNRPFYNSTFFHLRQ